MSRGPGLLQRAVLASIPGDGTQVTFGRVLWSVAEITGGVTTAGSTGPIPLGEVKGSTYRSVRRAVKGLVDDGKIQAVVQRPASVSEVCGSYPWVTHSTQVRWLRERLLPKLFEIAENEQGTFGPLKQERHLLRNRSELPAVVAAWRALEPVIALHVARSPVAVRDEWITLLAAGHGMFVTSSSVDAGSFRLAVERCAARDATAPLIKDLRAFLDLAFPPIQRGYTEWKALLYRVASFERNQAVRLHRSAEMALEQCAPEIFRSMPGYRPAPESWMRSLDELDLPVFGEMLKSLLDRHVFRKVQYLARVA